MTAVTQLLASECEVDQSLSFILSETLRCGEWCLAPETYPSVATGVVSFLVSARYCRQLQLFLVDSECFSRQPLIIGNASLEGYETYPKVQATTFVPSEQRRRTKVARTKAEISACIVGMPGLPQVIIIII